MIYPLYDRIAENSSTTGTGTMTVTSALINHARFSSVLTNGDRVVVAIVQADGSGRWEVCASIYSSNTLTRGRIKRSSTGSRVSFTAATEIFFVADAEVLSHTTWDLVRDFDADNTGATDCSAAYDAALGAILSAGGGTLYHQPGT